MSNHISENNAINLKGIFTSPASDQTENQRILKQQIRQLQDTLDQMEKQGNPQQGTVNSRPNLLPPKKVKDSNYLVILSEAFSKAYTSMAEGTIDQAKEFASLQQLDQTMSNSILRSTILAVDAEKKMFAVSEKLAAYEKSAQKADKILGDVVLALGIVIIVISIASAVWTAGSSLLLLGEDSALLSGEIGGGSMLEGGLEGGMDTSIEMDTFSDESVETGETGELSEGSEDSLDVQTDAIEDQSTEENTENTEESNTNRETNDQLNRSSKENANSKNEFAKKRLNWGAKKLAHTLVAGAFAAPMLIKGIQGLKTSKMLKNTAAAQEAVGKALAVMQTNNMDFQFYQQLLRQSSSVVDEEAKDASQVVQTFSDITNSINGITSGLANAV